MHNSPTSYGASLRAQPPTRRHNGGPRQASGPSLQGKHPLLMVGRLQEALLRLRVHRKRLWQLLRPRLRLGSRSGPLAPSWRRRPSAPTGSATGPRAVYQGPAAGPSSNSLPCSSKRRRSIHQPYSTSIYISISTGILPPRGPLQPAFRGRLVPRPCNRQVLAAPRRSFRGVLARGAGTACQRQHRRAVGRP